ncbi:unnamed protein product [Moneuplotes crassus]|uniref:Uncharacterized protein n=1 Tax=Euplotes crassus TaxID=5936 RepID=A0AAD1Y2Y1_EUPCR|nr:unnamed protein product [Moneuplotes crassus]
MDHQRFSNGTFDIEPYTTDTADCSFYNERETYRDNNKYLGKMYNNTFSDEPNLMPNHMYKYKQGSDNGHNPTLNQRFKKRMINQPLKLDKRRISRFQKQLAAQKRQGSDQESSTIPSIHPNLANNFNKRSKGLSTSRNKNIKLNRSLNGMPRLNDSLQARNFKLNLDSMNHSNENLELSSARESFNSKPGSMTGRKLFNFKRDGSDNPIKLLRQIRELNKVIEDKDTQINFLKKTVKFTEVNELKQENQILYQECRRLRSLCSQFLKKELDDFELEEEVKKSISQTVGDSTLKHKFQSKKSAIDELLEENDGTPKTILKKPTVKFADDLSGKARGKTILKKGDSKIIRKQTGYNRVEKKVFKNGRSPNSELEKIKEDSESISEKSLNHTESYRSSNGDKKPNTDLSNKMEQPRVSEDEISELLADLRFLLQVFKNASKFLFEEKFIISYEDAIQAFHEKLRISPEESKKLALYLIDYKSQGKKSAKSANSITANDIQEKIEEMVGSFRKYEKEEEQSLIDAFFSDDNRTYKPRFLSEMNDLSFVKWVSKNEFEKTLSNIPMDVNMKCLLIKLLRESNSLHMISGECIKKFVNLINSKSKHHHRPDKSYEEFEEDSASISTDSAKAAPNVLNLNKNFFVRLADFMFNNDLTLYQIIHKKIYDKMFNGREHELISAKTFFSILEERGFPTSEGEKGAIGNLLKNSNLIDVIEVEKVVKILEELDIKEDKPIASKNFDYRHLAAPDIRQVNRIIEYMEENNISEIEDFLGRERISKIEVIGKNKREDIEIIDIEQFTDCLEEKNLIENDDLSDGIQMFFAISLDNIDKLMIRKIKICIKDFKTVKFFKYYGTRFREEEEVISDDEDKDVEVISQRNKISEKDILRKNTMLNAKRMKTGRF